MTEPTLHAQKLSKFNINPVWIVPLLAVLVAAWMLYQNWSNQGPQITIVANNADGIEAGKTKVKAHSVNVGEVSKVSLSKDFQHALITVDINKNSQAILGKNTQFWVIKPRVGSSGISGLGTLLSGAYIEVKPGTKGDALSQYTMLDRPPLSTAQDKGIRVVLVSKDIAKMSAGAPVHFHGYDVGHIEDVHFNTQNKSIVYQVFIRAPFDALVNSAVQFWVTPGFEINSSAKGVAVKMNSVETLINGGISFGSTHKQAATPVADMTQFPLFNSKEEAVNKRFDKVIPYLFLFDGSISGLEKGAPVEFRGIRVGTVVEVPFKVTSMEKWRQIKETAIPILVNIEVQRLTDIGANPNETLTAWRKMMDEIIGQGFRATLVTRNLLSGNKVISIDRVPNPQPLGPKEILGYPVFPTVASGFTNLEQKLTALLDKLNALPLGQTVTTLNQTLEQAGTSLRQINKVSVQLNAILANPQTQALPKHLVTSLQELQRTLHNYQQDGGVGMQLESSLSALERTLDDLQPVLKQIQQKPNSLIFEDSPAADTVPGQGE